MKKDRGRKYVGQIVNFHTMYSITNFEAALYERTPVIVPAIVITCNVELLQVHLEVDLTKNIIVDGEQQTPELWHKLDTSSFWFCENVNKMDHKQIRSRFAIEKILKQL